ncbi:hypothetical protein [Leeuwenhoekiella nanhaiensis]|nr:hypothetical protein [Leeuwenhoekiella nanhaiensis]
MEFPTILNLNFETDHPNQRIDIYEGDFYLKNESQTFKCNGNIFFEWLPNLGSRFTGRLTRGKHPKFAGYYTIIVEDNIIGKVFLTNLTDSSESSFIEIQGVFNHECIYGDKSITVELVKFDIPNLKDYIGSIVSKDGGTFRNRIHFENDDFSIVIDKAIDYKDRLKKLKNKGGYLSLYTGELKLKKGSLNYETTKNILRSFGTFLSFLNGRKIAPIFYSGIYQGEKIWSDFSNYDISLYKYNSGWSSMFSIDGFKELFNKFLEIWKNDDDQNFLVSAIHWYNESNSNSGYAEGSIVMAQTALELLYNWLIIEKGNLLLGRDSENISASNKIRLLLSQIKMSKAAPLNFRELQSYITENPEIHDAPEAIVQIRNSIIHSQFEKRKKLSKLNSNTIHQALQLSILYIELSILYILGYNGEYEDRCSGNDYLTDRTKSVPWVETYQ